MRSQTFFPKKSSGFSLLEITIALFILAAGFAAVLSLVTKSIAVSSEFSNEVIVTNLAAENIELLINRRHTNWLRSCPYDFFDQDDNGDCIIDSGVTSTIPSCSGASLSTNINFYRDFIFDTDDMVRKRSISTIRLYAHSYPLPTPFYRRLELCKQSFPPNGPQDYFIKARSVGWWEERGRTRTIELTDRLYDWKP